MLGVGPFVAAGAHVPGTRLAQVGELQRFSPDLAARERWLVLNKLDLLENRDEKIAAFLQEFTDFDRHFAISAINGEGCKELTYAIMEYLQQLNEQEQQAAADSAQESDAGTI